MVVLENISAAYGLSRVLHNIDLQVGEGRTVALLGRNGVGKTTLLRTIVGLHPVSGGKILFGGEDLTRASACRRACAGIGYVPQGRCIFPHLTVEENLQVGFSALSGRRVDRLTSVPALVCDLFPALERLRHRKGGLLSGGEQQQLAIGRALVTRPKLLILDEPTEGIQPSIVQQIGQALTLIQREWNISILLVEQFLSFAWSLAQNYYVMRRGRIVQQGGTREATTLDSVAGLLNA